MDLKHKVEHFLEINPGFKIALIICLGVSFHFKFYLVVFSLSILLIAIYGFRSIQFLFPVLLFVFLFFHYFYAPWPLSKDVVGRARVHITQIKLSRGHFGSNWVLSGDIKKFEIKGEKALHNMPFKTYLPKGVKVPERNKDYYINGKLMGHDFYGYKLKIDKGSFFEPIERSFSLAKKRYTLKVKLRKFLLSNISERPAANFLGGMATADFDNIFLSYTFSRFGLSHLLAISGFHFGLLILFLNTLFSFLSSIKVRSILLIILLSFFYFFIGYGPSLQRAWMISLVYLVALIFEKRVSAINILSLSLAIILILDPYMLVNLGFQFSFLITYSILFFYRPIHEKITVQLEGKYKTIMKAISLEIAVHIAALPLSLYHFHKFYWLSIFYNLFMPPLIAFILFVLLCSLCLSLIYMPLAKILLVVDGFITQKILDTLFWIPISFDYCTRVPSFPAVIFICYLILFFGSGIYYFEKKANIKKIVI